MPRGGRDGSADFARFDDSLQHDTALNSLISRIRQRGTQIERGTDEQTAQSSALLALIPRPIRSCVGVSSIYAGSHTRFSVTVPERTIASRCATQAHSRATASISSEKDKAAQEALRLQHC